MRRTLNFHFHRVQFDFHFTVARIDVIKRLKTGQRVRYVEATGGAASGWLAASAPPLAGLKSTPIMVVAIGIRRVIFVDDDCR